MFNVAEAARIRAEYAQRARQIPADFYAWSRPVNRFFHAGVCGAAIDALVARGAFPLDGLSVADIGCGTGTWLLEFAQWGAAPKRMAGIDLNDDRIERAKTRLPDADLRVGDASALPWPDARFDIVSQFTVFTSVLDPEMKRRIAAEMLRVLKPGGAILWYDFRFGNPRNAMVRGVGADEIRRLFPGCRVALKSITLAPPLARGIVPRTALGAMVLEQIPLLRTHYLGIIYRNTTD